MRGWRAMVAAGALVLGAGLAGGCAMSTRVTNMWALPDFSTPLHSMLVIAMKNNDANRRIMEDAFVRELGKHGVAATPSYSLWPSTLPDTNAVSQYVHDNGIEGVLVAVREPTEQRRDVIPGYVTTEPRTYYSYWAGRYRTYWYDVEHEPTVETYSIVPHRIDVWQADAQGGQMVWTAQGRSIDPSSTTDVSREVSKSIVPELAKSGVIPQ